jgi:hypothetical protein
VGRIIRVVVRAPESTGLTARNRHGIDPADGASLSNSEK